MTDITSGNWFNEIHNADGEVKTHYEKIYRHWKSIPGHQKRRIHGRSRSLFSGDYPLDSLPRVLTQEELRILRAGVEQRATAIRAFLFDYYSRNRRWAKSLPPFVLRSIVSRTHKSNVIGKLDPKSIAFPYGPDIIRTHDGKWRVVEDSAGQLGGFGDLVAGRKILFNLVPGYRRLLQNSNDPKDYFVQLASHFRKKADEKGGIPLLFLGPFAVEKDHETERLASLFQNLGISVSTSDNTVKTLQTTKDGIFWQSPRKKQRVGFLALYSSPEQTDSRSIVLNFVDLAKSKFRPFQKNSPYYQVISYLKGWTIQSALLKNHAHTNFSPGVQFINDKMFGLYVDSLVRFYLKEEPILESIPAKSFAFRNSTGDWTCDKTIVKSVFSQIDRYVIKKVDEDGGSGVWIGRKLQSREFSKLRHLIRKNPEKYIFQDFEHLSVLENRIVDLRIHSQVDSETIIISNNPWGRANWTNKSGKVNLGADGFSSPVVVLDSW